MNTESKKRSAVIAIVTGCLTACLTACLIAIPAEAQENEDRSCSVATLKGGFGLYASGSRLVQPAGTPETHSTLALRVYDGKGGVKSWPIVSQGQISGVTEGNGQGQNGTYEVNPDCTGKVMLTLTTPNGPVAIVSRFVIVNRGKEIIEVPVTPGNVAVARLERQ